MLTLYLTGSLKAGTGIADLIALKISKEVSQSGGFLAFDLFFG